MYKLDFEKVEEPEIKLDPEILWLKEKARELKKKKKISTSASLTTQKPLTVWIKTNCGIVLKIWEYQTTLPTSWETCIQVKKQELELDMDKQTGSKLGKSTPRLYIVHPAYLTYMQFPSWETLGWMTPKLEFRLSGEIQTTSDM